MTTEKKKYRRRAALRAAKVGALHLPPLHSATNYRHLPSCSLWLDTFSPNNPGLRSAALGTDFSSCPGRLPPQAFHLSCSLLSCPGRLCSSCVCSLAAVYCRAQDISTITRLPQLPDAVFSRLLAQDGSLWQQFYRVLPRTVGGWRWPCGM